MCALLLLAACADVPTSAPSDADGFAAKKGGGPPPSTFPVTDVLPTPSGADGLFSDGLGSYPSIIDAQGTTSVSAQCSEGRTLAPQLPASWENAVTSGTRKYCDTKLDLNQLTACPDGTSCVLGTAGHDVTTHYALDVNYYFYVTAPKPNGHGTIQTEYDIVWTDVTYSVSRWAGAVPNGTACAWNVVGNTAEFWTGNPTNESRVGVNQPMALNVTVSRTDAACSP
jgi:hypothetical protein